MFIARPSTQSTRPSSVGAAWNRDWASPASAKRGMPKNMPLLTELGWRRGADRPINMALLTELGSGSNNGLEVGQAEFKFICHHGVGTDKNHAKLEKKTAPCRS